MKLEVGSAVELEGEDELTAEVTGRDLLSGLLRRIELPAAEVRTAIAAPVGRIVEAVHDTLERTPPELAADVADRGLVLVGGGGLLRGLDRLLAGRTGLPVAVAEETLTCVARGAGASLEEIASSPPAAAGAAKGLSRSTRPRPFRPCPGAVPGTRLEETWPVTDQRRLCAGSDPGHPQLLAIAAPDAHCEGTRPRGPCPRACPRDAAAGDMSREEVARTLEPGRCAAGPAARPRPARPAAARGCARPRRSARRRTGARAGEPEPGQHHDHRRERAPRLVVRAEVDV